MLLQSVEDPERFGVAHIQNRKIVEIEEKPKRAEKFLCGYGNLFV